MSKLTPLIVAKAIGEIGIFFGHNDSIHQNMLSCLDQVFGRRGGSDFSGWSNLEILNSLNREPYFRTI